MPTIADVAARAGVGLGTVSRALNGSPKVRDETRARVLDAIDTLGYRPNPLARGLSLGRCQTVGVVVPFFTQASAIERLRGVVAALDQSRYDLVLFNVESPVHRDEHLGALTRRDRADGLLIMSLPTPAREIERLTSSGVPIVLIDAEGTGVTAVVTDDVAGGRIAAQHLVDLGHRSIAFIGDDPENSFGFTSSAQRELGFRAVMGEAGAEVRRVLVRHGPHDREVAARIGHELFALADPPTAVFASSDVQATGVLAAAAAAGLRVPEDVSVIGFDDVELSGYVGLTTVRQPLFDSGYLGGQLLLEALTAPTPTASELAGRVYPLELELVVRATTAAPIPGRASARG